jgi:hypothetical protein
MIATRSLKGPLVQALGQIWGDVDPLARDFEEVSTRLHEPVHYGARLLFSHWEEKQREGGFQLGRDLPSRALSTTLRNLMIFEPAADGSDLRVRLAGSALLRRFGRDVTGLMLFDLFAGAQFERHRSQMADMLIDGEPFFRDVARKKGRNNRLHFEVLGLPVRSESGAPWALTGTFYHDWVG